MRFLAVRLFFICSKYPRDTDKRVCFNTCVIVTVKLFFLKNDSTKWLGFSEGAVLNGV